MADAERDTLTPEEYELWREPKQALNDLKSMSWDAATSMLVDHARAGLILTVARLIQFADEASPDREYQIMSREHWRQIRHDDLLNSYFWDTGTIKESDESARFELVLGIEHRGETPPAVISLGVRFAPRAVPAATKLPTPAPPFSNAPPPIPSINRPISRASGEVSLGELRRRESLSAAARSITDPELRDFISKTAGSLGQPDPLETPKRERPSGSDGARRKRPSRGAPVTEPEIREWYAALSPDDKVLGLAKLWDKSKRDHRPRHVVRKLIEPFVEGRKTGRKPKR
jgi:hypothetical protein